MYIKFTPAERRHGKFPHPPRGCCCTCRCTPAGGRSCPEIGTLALRTRESDHLWTGCPVESLLPPLFSLTFHFQTLVNNSAPSARWRHRISCADQKFANSVNAWVFSVAMVLHICAKPFLQPPSHPVLIPKGYFPFASSDGQWSGKPHFCP